MKTSTTYNLHSNCIPIEGANRSLIYDIYYNKYAFIPNELAKILRHNPSGKLRTIQRKYFKTNRKEFEEYFNFLEKEKYIFYFDFPDQFPRISLIFKSPFIISNAIIEISDLKDNHDTIKIISELHIPGIVMIIENNNKIFDYKNHLSYLEKSSTQHIDLIFRNFIEINELIFEEEARIHTIKIFNSSFENVHMLSDEVLKKVENKINGLIFDPKIRFNVNIQLFSESQLHHTYFNRKLYIGPNGEIKNAPECEETFGFIQDIQSAEELKEIITTKEFQKYWFVHKEITDVCKDCEFRHMCVDNRLPFQRAENEWYHKIECNYNPYICKWEDEEGYKTLEECGVKSDEKVFSIDHERIAEINEVLWGEE